MTFDEKINDIMARARELDATAQEALLTSLQTELAVARTMCILARQEHGEDRIQHVRQAETAFQTVLELAKRLAPNQELRRDMEQIRLDISALRNG